MTTGRSRLAHTAGPVTFAVCVVVLVLAGRGVLAPPPLDGAHRLDAVGDWVAQRGAVIAAAAWMFVATSVRGLAAAAGATRVVLAAEAAMPPALRRLLAGLAGAGVAGTVLVGAAGPTVGLADAPPPVERMVRLPPEGEPGAPAPPESSAEPVTAAMSVLPPVAPAAPVGSAGDQWVVAAGESFWSIAEDVVTDRLGRPPGDAEIARYWVRLVDANADRLVSGEADLIYPGQVFVLPA
jgi:nucleoid-associated protein YgaU